MKLGIVNNQFNLCQKYEGCTLQYKQTYFPFGFSVGNFHFEKGYKGETKIIMGMKQINF